MSRLSKFLVVTSFWTFCDSLHVLRVRVSFVVEDAGDSEINRLFDLLFRPSATR